MNEPILGGPTFAALAQNDTTLWLGLKTARIEHKTLGAGVVSEVLMAPGQSTTVIIVFGELPPKKFTSAAFSTGVVTSIVLPAALHPTFEKWIAAKRQEDAQDAAVEGLRARLVQSGHCNLSRHALQSIAAKMTAVEDLIAWEIDALVEEKAYPVLVEHFHRRYLKTASEWDLVKTCAYLRMEGLSENVLSLSSSRLMQPQSEHRARAALYTVRGAAFHDLQRFDEAQLAVEKSIEIHPNSPHAYYLLSSIMRSIGDKRAGDRLLAAAKKLGNAPASYESGLKHLLNFEYVGQ